MLRVVRQSGQSEQAALRPRDSRRVLAPVEAVELSRFALVAVA